jgi:hypothetical protein
MARYRLTAAGASLYPALSYQSVYEAAGIPDDIGGVFLHVPIGKSPRYVLLHHLELVPEDAELAPPADPARSIDVPGVSGRQPDGSWILNDASVERPDLSKIYPPPSTD